MKKILLFASVLLSSSTSFSQVTNGLIADYNFNACNGQDGILPKAYGTPTSVTYVADRFSNPAAAASFTGASTIELGSPSKANVSTGLTISSWIKLANVSGQKAIVSKWIGVTANDQYLFMINGNKTFIAVGNPSNVANGYSGTTSLVANTWYHIVATWDNSGRHQTYVNGVLDVDVVNTAFSTINGTSATALYIGSQGSNRLFNGAIDDVQLFNRKLTPSEILDLYNAPNPIVNGLVSKYSFDTGGAVDEVSNNDAVGLGINYGTDRFGNSGKALDVSFGNTYLNLYDSYDGFAATATGKISYSFWVNFKNITGTQQILLGKSADAGCSGIDRQFLFRLNTNAKFEITSYSSVGPGNYVTLAANNVTCTTSQWYHVVLTYDAAVIGNGKYEIYINNNLQPLTETGTSGAGIGTGFADANACIGVGAYLKSDGSICVNTQRLDAYFDDLNIYNKRLNGTEISDLYSAPNPVVGLNDILGKKNGLVYPNPFANELNVKSSGNGNSTVEIISVEGKVVLRTEFSEQNFSINTNELNQGIYFLILTNSEGKSIYKTIKN
ncbi:MAG: LamG-like jellyroll fold domain-containing protein [Bacteroidota bacterium]|nr:LamG-like jellyroll fold domain-containing protein [Bacteroidota bacterium]